MQVQRSEIFLDCQRVEGGRTSTALREARVSGRFGCATVCSIRPGRHNRDGAHWLRRKAASSPFSFFVVDIIHLFHHSTTPHATSILQTLDIHINHTLVYIYSRSHNSQWPRERAHQASLRVNHHCLLFWSPHHHRVARIALRGDEGLGSPHTACDEYLAPGHTSQLSTATPWRTAAALMNQNHRANLLHRR